MRRFLSPPARLAVWILLVVGLFCGDLAWLLLLRRGVMAVGGPVALNIIAIALFALLATTPRDAIRLPRRWSDGIILAGAAALELAAIYLLHPTLAVDALRIPALSAVLAPSAALLLLRLLGRFDHSAWWAVLLAWHPLLLRETAGRGRCGIVAAVLIVEIMLLVFSRERRKKNLATDGAQMHTDKPAEN